MTYKVKETDMQEVKDSIEDVKKNVGGTYRKFFSDFQQFMYSNNVLVAATGICVGMATKEVIEKLLNLIVLPIVQLAMKYSIVHIAYYKSIAYISRPEVLLIFTIFGEILWSVFVWIVIIVLTFVMLEYLLNRNVLGLKSVVKDAEKINYVKSKTEAKESIIPTEAEVVKLDKEEKAETNAGKQLQKIEEKDVKKSETDTNASIAVIASKSETIAKQIEDESKNPNKMQEQRSLDTFFAPLHF
jgi:large-conductance mechanosensitive channel